MSTGLEVITPGLMTSVQDRGRFGFQALGISVSGALDPDGFDLANALAGNEAGTGALEIRMLGPTLEVTAESVTVALAGTGAGIEVMSPEREMISACRSVTFRKGQVFRIGAVTQRCLLSRCPWRLRPAPDLWLPVDLLVGWLRRVPRAHPGKGGLPAAAQGRC